MENAVKIKFWGVRGSTPCPNTDYMEYGGNTTCVQIMIPGTNELLIADCGTGVRNLGNDISSAGNALKGRMFITHPHWDHIQGFPFFKPLLTANNHFSVYMLPAEGLGCEEIMREHLSKTFFPVTLDMLSANIDYITLGKRETDFGAYSVEYMEANHTIATAAFKFTAGGKTIVFAPDNELPVLRNEESTRFIEEFREFVRGADVLIHDGQFDKTQYYDHIGWGHSDWFTLLETVKDLGIGKVYITHHSPDNKDGLLRAWDREIRESYASYFEEVQLAKEGMVVTA